MNVLILSKNYEKYTSGYYHQDIINSFVRIGNCFLYGEGYPRYDNDDTIEDVIHKSPFEKDDIDLIVVSTSWEMQSPAIEQSDPHPKINLSRIEIPKFFFLNKEYKKIDKKLEYAKENNFDLVLTVHHDYKKWEIETGLKFYQLPFAVDQNRFRDYGLPRQYDFGFTGSLHKTHTDIRYNVKSILFGKDRISNIGTSNVFNRNPIKDQFRKYKIYWAEWGAKDLLGRSLLPSGAKYVNFLNKFKTFLSTPSAIGIVGTRYFECMATKTIVICPDSEHYGGMFKDGVNCVMFKRDLSDFEDKLIYILENDQDRERIRENAHSDFVNNHTYDKRIEEVLSQIDLST